MTRFLPQTKGLKHLFILQTLVLLAIILVSSSSLAESTATAEWNITADKITRFKEPESIIAEGNIVLEKREKIPPKAPRRKAEVSAWAELLEEEVKATELTPDDLPKDRKPKYETKAIIKADWVAYDIENQTIRARGNVSVDTGDDQLFADEAEVDLSKEIGSFGEAVIIRKDYDLHLEGSKIEKTGVKTYRIENGWVITCKIGMDEIPPWSFSSSEATVEQEGYAILKNAKFNIRNVPVFYTPYLVVPVKTQRQTGFLTPELSNSSRDGFGFNIPFFWNISESVDMTFYAEYFSDRGIMPGLEFRYIMDDQSKGKFNANYLDDDLSDPDELNYRADTGFTHTNTDRYWIRGKVDHDFGNNWISRLDIDFISDQDYLDEFTSGATGFNDSQKTYLNTFGRGFENQDDEERQNTFKLLKTWDGSSLNIDFVAIDDVREVEASPTPLMQLPSIEYTGALPVYDTPLTFEWDTDYVYYWREEGVGGHRLDLFPRLSAPVPVGPYLESRAELGGRGTLYSVDTFGDGVFEGDDNPTRFLFTFNTDIATSLIRDYSFKQEGSSYLRHSVRPFVEYTYISDDDQDDLPNLDSVDRIEEVSAITYGIDSFLNLLGMNEQRIRQYGFLRVNQSYDLLSDSETDFTPIDLKIGWTPLKKLWFVYKADIPVEGENTSTHGFEGYFSNSRGDIFAAEYRYNEEEDLEQINGYIKSRILPKIEAELKIEYSIAEEETNEGIATLTYLAQCWSVQLKGKYTPTDERIMLVFNLANIGTPLSISY